MIMSPLRIVGPWLLPAAALSLVACGGGGGDGGAPPAPATPPTSGSYAWVLKAQGPTDKLKYGLSLLHPAAPGTEFVIEAASAIVSDARTVVSGSVDVGGLKASALKPYALLYIVGGDVRRVPLEANGSAPTARVQRAQSTSACSFVVDANDQTTPENSRYIVSTAGADGQCDTADDGRAEVRLDGTLGLSYTPISGAAPLGTFRDVATLAPRGWIYPKSVQFWNPNISVTTRGTADPALTAVVSSTYRSALVDDTTQLSVIDFPAGTAPTESRLDAALTGGGGWSAIGFDANNHYVYRNGGTAAAPTWTVLKISRSAPAASVMASGGGEISVASLGSNLLYATVIGIADNRLLAISKSAGVAVNALETTPSSTLTTVLTSAGGVHQLWRVRNIGGAAITTSIEMIDETGAVLYTTPAGGFPLAVAEADVENFASSESRSRFVFASGWSASRAFADAALIGYDASTRTATSLGTLPGTADFGTDFVFASAMGGPAGFMTGFAARSTDGAVQGSGAKVFSFDAASANSLKVATSAQ